MLFAKDFFDNIILFGLGTPDSIDDFVWKLIEQKNAIIQLEVCFTLLTEALNTLFEVFLTYVSLATIAMLFTFYLLVVIRICAKPVRTGLDDKIINSADSLVSSTGNTKLKLLFRYATIQMYIVRRK